MNHDNQSSDVKNEAIEPQYGDSNAGTSVARDVHLPRVTIKYCTQCRWLLRAAYYAQELLSTFSTQLGEVALVPATGGIFTVTITHTTAAREEKSVLWDRKTDGGFPETKQLKALVRNVVDPSRDLGHVDRALAKQNDSQQQQQQQETGASSTSRDNQVKDSTAGKDAECEDCK